MHYFARQRGEDEEKWAIVGLLHDFDDEMHPTLDEHPRGGGDPAGARRAEEVVGGPQPRRPHRRLPGHAMEETLFAVDERPDCHRRGPGRPDKSIFDVEPSSVRKKMRTGLSARRQPRRHREGGPGVGRGPERPHRGGNQGDRRWPTNSACEARPKGGWGARRSPSLGRRDYLVVEISRFCEHDGGGSHAVEMQWPPAQRPRRKANVGGREHAEKAQSPKNITGQATGLRAATRARPAPRR